MYRFKIAFLRRYCAKPRYDEPFLYKKARFYKCALDCKNGSFENGAHSQHSVV